MSDVSFSENSKSELVKTLKALANEQRLSILCLLRGGEQSVSALRQQLPLSQSALSQHLAWLREARLVSCRREAQCMIYKLDDPRITAMLNQFAHLYGGQADA